MIPFSFPACGRGNSARRALPGESVGRKGGLGPSGLFTGCRPDLLGVPSRASPLDGRGLDTLQGISHPQSLPLGGRTVRGTVRSGPGEATINHRWAGEAGSDEGAIWYPTFSCRKRRVTDGRLNGIFLLPRWATRSPPHQSPPVTASPQGEASGLCSPTRKSAPNQGTYMGYEIAPRTDQRERSPKRASDSKRTIKPGVQGRSPGPLSPHFSGEMGTPAGQAGPPGRCAPRPVSALPTRRVRSTRLPLAGGLGWDHRRSRPATWVPARSRAGDPGFL